jgi:hypothetical protein
MPLYYDFRIRKYSLTAVEKEHPEAKAFGARQEAASARIRPLSTDKEAEYVTKYHRFLYPTANPVNPLFIKQAALMLPELNFIVYDPAGFYAGHYSVFPISAVTFQKLKNRELVAGDLRESHLRNFKTETPPAFFSYSLYADSNQHFYYLTAAFIRALKTYLTGDYLYGALMVRHDAKKFAEQMGFKKVWEDKEEQEKLKMLSPPTFLEGKFSRTFLGG